MTDQNTIAYKIKKYRKEQGMSQEELSSRSGINLSTIKKYETGYRNPKPEQLLKISSALGVSINAFIEFEISTVSDVISLLMRMDEQTDMIWTGEKDNTGNYIPSSISISFKDEQVNNALSTYMNYREQKNSDIVTDNTTPSELSVDYISDDLGIVLENTRNRLLLSNTIIKKSAPLLRR